MTVLIFGSFYHQRFCRRVKCCTPPPALGTSERSSVPSTVLVIQFHLRPVCTLRNGISKAEGKKEEAKS